jgi:hypothetical protein
MHGVIIQCLTAWRYNRVQKFNKNEYELFYFLRRLPKTSVIATRLKNENLMIPAATDNFSYTPYATMTIATIDELIERNIILDSLYYRNDEIYNKYDAEIYRESYGELNLPYTREKQINLRKILKQKTAKLKDNHHYFKINYLLALKEEKIRDSYFKIKKVFQNNKYSVYRLF